MGAGGGGRLLTIMACTERLPRKGYFFRLQVFERVGISLFEVHEKGKSVIWVCERVQRAGQMIFMAL